MMKPIVDDMVNKGVKKIGYIGFDNLWGDIVLLSI